MNTQNTMMETQTAQLAANVYDMRALADTELDALLAVENAEIQSMQIADAEDLAELERLISPQALQDLDILCEAEDWLLAS